LQPSREYALRPLSRVYRFVPVNPKNLTNSTVKVVGFGVESRASTIGSPVFGVQIRPRKRAPACLSTNVLNLATSNCKIRRRAGRPEITILIAIGVLLNPPDESKGYFDPLFPIAKNVPVPLDQRPQYRSQWPCDSNRIIFIFCSPNSFAAVRKYPFGTSGQLIPSHTSLHENYALMN